jgi:hypothetical protein
MTTSAEASEASLARSRRKARLGSAATRRLVGGLALCACLSFGMGLAQARHSPGRPGGGISVDVGPLIELGARVVAEDLRGDLTQALQAQFAGRLGPGQRLVAQIRGITLNTYVGGTSPFGSNDYLDGAVALIGADGREIASQKILVVLPASSGGAWYLPGGERRRIAGLALAFASWARRYMPG